MASVGGHKADEHSEESKITEVSSETFGEAKMNDSMPFVPENKQNSTEASSSDSPN